MSRAAVFVCAGWAALVLSACGEMPPGGDGALLDFSNAPADLGFRSDDLGPHGALRLVVLDDETGLPLPARAIVTAVEPTAPVSFDDTPGSIGIPLSPGVIGAPEGVLLVAGDGAFLIPAGTYDITLTHGPEWETHEERITVANDTDTTVTGSLRHSVDTSGWLGADLHVHTGRSYDSGLPTYDRVVTEVSVGVEVIVATDHNVLTDLQPEIDAFGYGRMARAIVGNEFNYREGHGGAYPMPYDGTQPFGGTMEFGLDWTMVKDVTAGDVFDKMHAFNTHPAVSINHPRLPPDLGYFLNINWAPPMPLPTAGKFDAMELMTGYMDQPDQIAVLMRDWFFLLSSGNRVAALGSSDTHRLASVKAGFPRTWLRMPTEDPSKIQGSDLADALRENRTIASNGPFLLLQAGSAQIGDLTSSSGGNVQLEVTADAPAWIDVDTVRIYVNGEKVQQFSVTPGQRPLFHKVWTQPVAAGDGWVVAQASGSKPLPSAIVGDVNLQYSPFALTSPIYLDGDDDGRWAPNIPNPDPGPGLPIPPDLYFAPRDAPEDCEPPLWVDPRTWVNPAMPGMQGVR
jgi:hypothetical protein